MRRKGGQSEKNKGGLRKRAEKLLIENPTTLSNTEVQDLIHELKVYQVELEMQKEELRRAQIELEESHKRYVELYDFAPVGYFTLDEKGLILDVNLAGATLLGVGKRYLMKRLFSNYIAKEDKGSFYHYRKRLLKTTTRQTCELRMLRKDGTHLHAQLEGIAIHDSKENVSHFRVAVLDVTRCKMAEELLRKAHDELETKVRERTQELTKVNEMMHAEIAERSRMEGALRESLAHVAKRKRYEIIISTVIRSVHQSIDLQEVFENAVESMNKNIEGVDNVSIYLVEGEEAILRAHRGYPDWFIERVRRVPYPIGFTWKTIIERRPVYCTDVDNDSVIGPAGREVGTKSYLSIPIHLGDKTVGTISIDSFRKNAFDNEEIELLENVAQQIGVAISNAKQAEALRESEERYRNLFENIPIGIYRITPDGRILMANPALIKMLGYPSFSELASHNLEEEGFQPTYQRSRFKELIEQQDEVKGLESEWMRLDGSIIPVRENAKAIRGEDGTVLYYEGTVEDITERKLAEEKFRLVVESAPNAIVMTNQRGEIILVNSQTERLFGYNREELIGRSVEILIPEKFRRKHSEYRTGFHHAPQARSMGGRDLIALRKDGSEFPVEIGLTPIQTDEGLMVLSSIVDITQRKRMEEALRESEERLRAIMDNTADAIFVYDEKGSVIAINREAQRLFCAKGKNEIKSIWDIIPSEDRAKFSEKLRSVKEGNKLLDYETYKALESGERIPVSVGLVYVADGGGRFIETVRDIRERVMLRNKIIEIEKAQVVGKMAEGIAHHMGTPLASMLLRVQMLREDMPKIPGYEKIVEKLDSIERQIFYSQRVIQKLLKFVSKPENEKSPERVSALLEDSVEIISPLLKKREIEMELSVNEDPTVLVDSNLLKLVFVDIMMNAVDAMPEGGRLSITASRSNPKKLVDIVISDTGMGIPKELLPLVFEPFFSTKPSGKGTGLGLSVAKRIIHDHGGEINIESIEGRGTSVFIKLPIYVEEKGIAQV